MRMWMVDPKLMCYKHLSGEHVEIHMLVGCLYKDKSLSGFAQKNIIELGSLEARHEALANELLERKGAGGSWHQSPLPWLIRLLLAQRKHARPWEFVKVDIEESKSELMRRCSECRVLLLAHDRWTERESFEDRLDRTWLYAAHTGGIEAAMFAEGLFTFLKIGCRSVYVDKEC